MKKSASRKNQSRVKSRRRRTTRKTIPKHTQIVVVGKLYATWCHFCNELLPEWEKVKHYLEEKHREIMPNSKIRYKVVAIEQTQMEKKIPLLNSRYLANSEQKVVPPNGFPTIFRIYGGRLEYFNGSRDFQTMLTWATHPAPHAPAQGGL